MCLIVGCETWPMKVECEVKLDRNEMNMHEAVVLRIKNQQFVLTFDQLSLCCFFRVTG